MTWGDALENVNYTVAFVAALIPLAVGYLWYGPLFENNWLKLVGLKKKDVRSRTGMPTVFITMLVFNFLAAIVVSALLKLTGQTGGGDGALMGVILGVALTFGPMASSYAFARRRIELSLIDGGFHILKFVLIGWIVGIWV